LSAAIACCTDVFGSAADARSSPVTRTTPLWKPVRSASSISWKMWKAESVGSQFERWTSFS